MIYWRRRLAPLVACAVLLAGCQHVEASTRAGQVARGAPSTAAQSANALLITNGEPNLTKLSHRLIAARQRSVHIVQLGDSHTAADFMSGQLRALLQQRFGNGGIGFISPLSLPGQRYSSIALHSKARDWTLAISRRDERLNFPLGGSIAEPRGSNRTISFTPLSPNAADTAPEGMRVRLLYATLRQNTLIADNGDNRRVIPLRTTQGKWAFSYPMNLALPAAMSIASGTADTRLGGWYLDGPGNGVILSALGSNGASLSLLDRWQDSWQTQLKALRPDAVILAYGTNEAFNDSLNLDEYRAQLLKRIRQIRSEMPEAVVMLLGPGDSMKDKSGGSCYRDTRLDDVIRIQQQAARSEHALYWDWRRYMGGACSIRHWMARGDARPDFVHLTQSGYEKSADRLYHDLMSALHISP